MHPMWGRKGGNVMKFNDRKSISDNLAKYLICAKEDDFVEITEWTNEEGWDISINDKIISLSREELDMINFLTKALEYGKNIMDREG